MPKKITTAPQTPSGPGNDDACQLKSDSVEDIFTKVYNSHAWTGKDSVSGPGSDVRQTRIIRQEIPALFHEFGISTMLDIPCGDFYWMKDVDLGSIAYTGADIVRDLVRNNTEEYARSGVRFQHLDLLEDKLPAMDLILCRDCLVHFSYANIFQALENLCSSGSGYLLATTFTQREHNQDIPTGLWRPLNLEISPFEFPVPLKTINEGCEENYGGQGGAFRDKALGLWQLSDIREILARR